MFDETRRIDELRRALWGVDASAYLVEGRVIRRVIRSRLGLGQVSSLVPHAESTLVRQQDLKGWVHPDELGLTSFELLPELAILVALPEEGELDHWPLEELKLQVWRRLFHAQIDRLLVPLEDATKLPQVQARIADLGQVEFDEAHHVLRSELRLMHPDSRVEAYREWVARYLEFAYFEPDLLPVWFPSLAGVPEIGSHMAEGIDAARLFRESELEGSAKPDLTAHDARDEAALALARRGWSTGLGITPTDRGYTAQLRGQARAREGGNTVLAICRGLQAAQRATSSAKRKIAEKNSADDVRLLVDRLQAALEFPDRQKPIWEGSLTALSKLAVQGFWNAERKLLFDLQKVCLDHERISYRIDLIKWIASLGRRPLRRPLPNLQEVSMAKHLASAAQRLIHVRLSGRERDQLTHLLENARALSEEQMRERLRPQLKETLRDVGLEPHSVPEENGFDKLIEDSLDSIAERGYLSMGYLRDAVSRNDLKLPDLERPRELWSGDRLLQADERLDVALDGVYRRGDFYLRWIQMISAIFFGTRWGRFATLFLILPFGGALVLVEGFRHILHLFQPSHQHAVAAGDVGHSEAAEKAADEVEETEEAEATPIDAEGLRQPSAVDATELVAGQPVEGLGAASLDPEVVGEVTLVAPETADQAVDQIVSRQMDTFYWVLTVGLVLMALIHSQRFRRICWDLLVQTGKWLHWLVVELPREALPWEWLAQVWNSVPLQLARRLVLLPLMITWLGERWIWLVVGGKGASWQSMALTTALLSAAFNTRWGRDLQELAYEGAVRVWHQLGPRLLFAVIDWFVDGFRVILQAIERLLYAVDEWLRFHSRENIFTLIAKAVLGVIWSVVSFLIRIYVNLLIEPTFHPVKHFPVVTVAHKIFLPALIMLEGNMVRFLGQYIGKPLARSVTWFNIFFLPGFFGFAVWELKENWRLFRANRREQLGKVVVGSHGESVARLLRPGFHSGTLPKIFRKLRKLEQQPPSFRRFSRRRAALQSLHHVTEAIHRFVERDFLHLIQRCDAWREHPLACSHVEAATNSFMVDIECPTLSSSPMKLVLQEQSGWIVAATIQPGWLTNINDKQQKIYELALEGFYRKCGVHLVREQIEDQLTHGRPYDIQSVGIVVWEDETFAEACEIELRGDQLVQFRPASLASRMGLDGIDKERWMFASTVTFWEQWESRWQQATE